MCGKSQEPMVFWSMSVKPFPFLVFMQIAEDMANREDVAELPKDGKPLPVETPAPRGRLRILAPLVVFAGLFGAALLGSWQLREHFFDDDEVKTTTKVEPPASSLKKAEPAGSASEILDRGDQALAMHRF